MIRRRLLAIFILLTAAIGSSLYWNDGAFDLATTSANLIAASLGFLFLHHKWKAQEAEAMTPKKAKDIFS